jgi:hypothetical protein
MNIADVYGLACFRGSNWLVWRQGEWFLWRAFEPRRASRWDQARVACLN